MPYLNTFGDDARNGMLAGAKKLCRAVGSSMGPMGRNTIIDWAPFQPACPTSTRDGVTIARTFYLSDPVEDAGNRLIRAASEKAVQQAGDGTSAAVVLATGIFEEGLNALKAGRSVVAVKNEIELDVETVCQEVDKVKTRLSGNMIDQVATIATNNDPILGGLIADAMRKAGPRGVVAVEDAPGVETTIERQEGMQFDQGFITPAFVTNAERQIVEFQSPLILLLDRPLTSMQGMLKMMEAIAAQSRPLLILAEDVTGEALATLVTNKLRGGLSVCCVKLPSNLGHRKDLLLDIAALTGGTAIIQELGLDVSTMKPTHFGQARSVIVNSSTTRIIGGFGKPEEIAKRVEQITGLLGQNPTALEAERLRERLAKLTGGVTVLKLGAQTGVELEDKKARCDDACHATRCALEDGIVPGGGFTLARIARNLPAGIVKRAIQRPCLQILENAGAWGKLAVPRPEPTRWQKFCRAVCFWRYEPSVPVLVDVQLDNPNPNWGYNSLTGEFGDLIQMGIIDPAKVIKSSLRNAASVAVQMLLTELVTQVLPKG